VALGVRVQVLHSVPELAYYKQARAAVVTCLHQAALYKKHLMEYVRATPEADQYELLPTPLLVDVVEFMRDVQLYQQRHLGQPSAEVAAEPPPPTPLTRIVQLGREKLPSLLRELLALNPAVGYFHDLLSVSGTDNESSYTSFPHSRARGDFQEDEETAQSDAASMDIDPGQPSAEPPPPVKRILQLGREQLPSLVRELLALNPALGYFHDTLGTSGTDGASYTSFHRGHTREALQGEGETEQSDAVNMDIDLGEDKGLRSALTRWVQDALISHLRHTCKTS
jgi:hypothetical protein